MSGEVINISETGDFDGLLAKLPHLFRAKAMDAALVAAGKVVIKRAKELCPVGQSRTGKKLGKKHLRDTITQVVRDRGDAAYTVVGPAYPAGAQGHLVEDGHAEFLFGKPTGRRVPPHPFMRPAVDGTRDEQTAAAVGVLKKLVSEEEAKHK